MSNWRRVVGGKIGRMSEQDALDTIAKINAEHTGPGATIHHPTIQALTGGFYGQAVNAYVMRQLGVKAGVIKDMK